MGLQFNPAEAEELFQGCGYTYAQLRKMADAGERLPTFRWQSGFGRIWTSSSST